MRQFARDRMEIAKYGAVRNPNGMLRSKEQKKLLALL